MTLSVDQTISIGNTGKAPNWQKNADEIHAKKVKGCALAILASLGAITALITAGVFLSLPPVFVITVIESPLLLMIPLAIVEKEYWIEELELYNKIASAITGETKIENSFVTITQSVSPAPSLFQYATPLPHAIRLKMIKQNPTLTLLTKDVLEKDSRFKAYLINVAENEPEFAQKHTILANYLKEKGIIGRIISRARYIFRDTFVRTKTL